MQWGSGAWQELGSSGPTPIKVCPACEGSSTCCSHALKTAGHCWGHEDVFASSCTLVHVCFHAAEIAALTEGQARVHTMTALHGLTLFLWWQCCYMTFRLHVWHRAAITSTAMPPRAEWLVPRLFSLGAPKAPLLELN